MLAKFFANAPKEGLTAEDTKGWNLVEADDIAAAIVWLLSEDSNTIVGTNLPVGSAPP